MVKRKNQVLIDSESDGSLNDSGSDLDSEFLSLAKKKKTAGAAAEDGNSAAVPAPLELQQVSDSDTSDSDDDWDARGKARKKKKKGSRAKRSEKRTKSASSDSEHESEAKSEPEEGEVPDSNSSSDESDMSEYRDEYDENLMGDEADRARLAQMTEKEREQEIFKRIEHREVMKTRFEIEKKLRQARRREQKKSRGLGTMKIDAKERSKERKKTVEENKGKVDKKAQAMSLLKARREEKKERAEEKQKEKQRLESEKQQDDEDVEEEEREERQDDEKATRKKLKASDIYSDDSASDSEEASGKERKSKRSSSSDQSGSESDSDQKSSRGKPKRPQYISTKEELHKIKLSRHKIERWIHLPIFTKVAKGCFVRIGIGTNNGRPVYRVAEVIDVVETGKIYQLGTTRTNKGFKLKHGANERVFRLEFVSNQEFSDSEFQKWRDTCMCQGITMPAIEEVDRKQKELADAINYEYKEEDIEQIIKEKERFKKTTYNYAMKKTRLIKEREMAVGRGDDDEASKIGKELQELEERAVELDKLRTSSISSISYINERNRKRNVEEAEKAIMEENLANKGKKVDDPFTRRSTKPRMLHKSLGAPTEPEPVTPKVPIEVEEKKENVAEDKPTSTGGGGQDKPNKMGDLFSAHNFDIKINLEMPLPSAPINVTLKTPEGVRESAPRRSLNLEDYKKKRGLI